VSEQVPDAELAERAVQGSADALGALFRRHAPGVHRLAYALLRSAAEADDVVQDVFVGLPRALRGYAGRGPLEAWIRRIAARTALMRLRARRRRREDPLDPADEPGAARDAPVDRVALERAIGSLPEPLRTVFVLKVVEGYPHEEIARLVGITPEASKVRLFRARRALQSLLT
jgi:RNA polymerase sigma-70 factor (ECF subfamily)